MTRFDHLAAHTQRSPPFARPCGLWRPAAKRRAFGDVPQPRVREESVGALLLVVGIDERWYVLLCDQFDHGLLSNLGLMNSSVR
jgi:hypothetical protein